MFGRVSRLFNTKLNIKYIGNEAADMKLDTCIFKGYSIEQ